MQQASTITLDLRKIGDIREAISPHLYSDQDFRKQAVACAKGRDERGRQIAKDTLVVCARRRMRTVGLACRRVDLLAQP